jgi:teichuronic acid exporter
LENPIKNKAFKGILWSAFDRIGYQLISIGITIILARLLTPADYGTIGMLTLFIALSNLFIESGLGQALIQKKEPSDEDISTVFYYNFLLSILLYIILFVSAPIIAHFFKLPILIPITRILGLTIIINSLSIVQITVLQKNINFKSISIINLASCALSGTLAIVLATKGYGVWSLVYYTLSSAVFKFILFWIFAKWLPSMIFSISSFKSLFGFGSKILMAGLLGTITNNLINLVVGKLYVPSVLGFYTQARRIMEIPSVNITQIIQNVSYPLLAKIQDDEQKLKTAYRKIYVMTSFILLPTMLGMIILSEPIIYFLLGKQWLKCVALLQWLCVFGLLNPLSAINVNILKVKAKTAIYLKLSLFNQILQLLILLITVSFGIETMTIGIAIYSIIFFTRNSYISGKEISYPLLEQLSDIKVIFFITIIMISIVWMISKFILTNTIWNLLLLILVGILVYIIFSILFLKPIINEIKEFIKVINFKVK